MATAMLTTTRGPALSTIDLLVGYAIAAPSSHNTQPWRFETDDVSHVRLYADRTRRLPVNDPDDRELVISCGAALENLVIAARAFGFDAVVTLAPNPAAPDLLAAIAIVPGDWPTDEEALLFDAMATRHTCRTAFVDAPVPAWIAAALDAAAATHGGWLAPIAGPDRLALRTLVEEGDRLLFSNPRWRRELASWMHAPHAADDGLMWERGPAALGRLVVRSVNLGARMGAVDGPLVENAPLVVVLGGPSDSLADWIAAGRALERVLLTAARHGVQAGFLNQPCQIPHLRDRVRTLIARSGRPQLVLRFGQPAAASIPSPRRPLRAAV